MSGHKVSTPPWRDLWVWLGAVLVGLSMVGALWAGALLLPAPDAALGQGAWLTVIPAPAATATPRATSTPLIATTTPVAPPPPREGVVTVGAYVQIRGTGGDGLRLRAQPGLDAPILALAKEEEVFRVAEGPHSADGYTWWRLEAPDGAPRGGWAVANYLSVLPVTAMPTATP